MGKILARAALLALFIVAPMRALAADITITWDNNPEPDVIGYKVYMGTVPGVFTNSYDVGPVTAHTYPNATPDVTYYFAVSAYVEGDLEGPRSSSVSMVVPGRPVLVNPGSRTTEVGTAVALRLIATTNGGYPVSYDATQLPFDARLNAATGEITGTLTNASLGTYNTTVTAINTKDTSQTAAHTFTWVVTLPPDVTPPTLSMATPGSTAITSAMWMMVSGVASDDRDLTHVTWTSDRGGAGTATGTSNWVASVPLQSGANVVAVTAWDSANNSTTTVTSITYVPPPVLAITVPTAAATHETAVASLMLGGTAIGSGGVTSVTWTNDRGGSGSATGTDNWTIGTIQPTVVFQDEFTGATNVDLAQITPTTSGAGWVEVVDTGSNAVQRRVSGYMQPKTSDTSGTGALIYGAIPSAAITAANYDVSVKLVGTGGYDDAAAIIFGYRDPDNYCGVVWYGSLQKGDLVLFKRVAGTASDIWVTDVNPANGDVIAVAARGSSLTVTQNGVSRITTTDAFCAEANGVGVGYGAVRGVAGDDIASGTRLDNFVVTDHDAVVGGISLQPGVNTITVTAQDALGSVGQNTVTVTSTSPTDEPSQNTP